MGLLLLGALSQELLEMALGRQGTEALSLYLVSKPPWHHAKSDDVQVSYSCPSQTPVVKVFDSLSVEQQLYGCGGLALLSFLLLLVGRFSFK